MCCDDSKTAAFERAPLFLLPLLIGVVQIVGYYLAAMFASTDGAIPVAQPDTLLYCQAARRICEGAPFSFSFGTAVSTGTTSVLYPFFLAVPYYVGFTGESLLSAGFWLNAGCYLVFLLGWTMAAAKWVVDPRARLLAVVLVALMGQPAYCAMAQSDIGLWLAVSAMVAATLPDDSCSSRWRDIAFVGLLSISPWVRPEGMMLILALCIVYGVRFLFDRKACSLSFVLSRLSLPVLSVLGVFALNYFLTGQFQFSSVANKGYLKNLSLASAVMRMFHDGWTMLKGLGLSLPDSLPRSLITIPLAGGLAMFLGMVVHSWRRQHFAWILAVSLGFVSVADSQFQGTNMDRYLAWAAPLVAVFTAEGVVWLRDKLNGYPAAAMIPLAFVLYFSATSFAYFCVFCNTSRQSDQLRAFAGQCEQLMPKGASVAATGECGVAYFMSQRRVAQLSGLYSPEFEYMSMDERMDDLKRNPGKRFDYWLFGDEFLGQRKGDLAEKTFGKCILAGPVARALNEADWTAFDNAARPPMARDGETLVARVDVGYRPDEREAGYEVIDRWSRRPASPFYICCKNVAGEYLVDVGRVLIGGDAMSVRLTPGRDVRVVMRQLAFGGATIGDGVSSETIQGAMPERYSLNLGVDGNVISKVELDCDQKWFSEVSFTIPGSAIRHEITRLEFLGDHIPFGYWFYQKVDL